jgi:phage-related baseplate assembly protein
MSVDLWSLPEVEFADVDTARIEADIIRMYEGLTNTVLYPGDPVRLFLSTLAAVIAQRNVLLDYTGKMNLLRYARGDYLDHLGALLDVNRLPAAPARTVLEFTLAAPLAYPALVPEGTRATADSVVFWATDELLTILPGEVSGRVGATCLTEGTASNALVAGQINRLVDALAYVSRVENIETTAGGSDIEDDARLRERIRIAPEQFTTAGSEGAYHFWAISAHADIENVAVLSEPLFPPGEVHLFLLLTGGRLPEADGPEVELVRRAVNMTRRRPLTDHVFVAPAEAYPVDYTVRWFITTLQAPQVLEIEARIKAAVAEYEAWQTAVIARGLNPDRLIQLCRGAGAKRVELARITEGVDDEDNAVEVAGPFEYVSLDGTPKVVQVVPRADRVIFGAIEGE